MAERKPLAEVNSHTSALLNIMKRGAVPLEPPSPEPEPLAPHPRTLDVMLGEGVMGFLTASQLRGMASVCTALKEALDSEDGWYACCFALASQHCLHLPATAPAGWKGMFLEHLWPARGKWSPDARPTSFSVQVAARFRPGNTSDAAITLPLHQRLKLRKEGESLTEEEPKEFLDPLLSTVMRNPVKLPSGCTMDRGVIMQHLRASATDPFTGEPLSADDLVPDSDLQARIHAWLDARRSADGASRLAVSAEAVTKLVEASDDAVLSPEVLQALLEAQQLSSAAQRAQVSDTRRKVRRRHAGAGAGDDVDADAVVEALAHEDAAVGGGEGGGAGASGEDSEDAGDSWPTVGEVDDMPEHKVSPEEESGAPEAAREEEGLSRRRERPRILAVQPSKVTAYVPGAGMRPFLFSNVFDEDASQDEVYARVAHKAVVDVLNGFNSCILAYGQTSSGKTHTVFGPDDVMETAMAEAKANLMLSSAGVAIRAVAEILRAVGADGARVGHLNARTAGAGGLGNVTAHMTMQYVHVYQGRVTDLFTGRQVRPYASADTVHLSGATEATASSFQEAMDLLAVGEARKMRASTAMNDRSSRAHTILILGVTQTRSGTDSMVRSTLHIVDLAGSERLKKSKVDGRRREEAIGINTALMTLGKVITALVEEHSHVPFLESELTKILRPAFGGSSRTTAIMTAWLDSEHGEETVQTLRFGERVSMVTNTVSQAATSVEAALDAIDAAVTEVSAQLVALRDRGLSKSSVVQKLEHRLRQLVLRRQMLGGGTE